MCRGRWRSDAVPGTQNAAVSSGGLLYVAGGGEHSGAVAVDAATGRTRWQAPVPDPNGTLKASPAVAGGAVSLTVDGKLVNLEAATGKPRWTAVINNSNDGGVPLSGAAEGHDLPVELWRVVVLTAAITTTRHNSTVGTVVVGLAGEPAQTNSRGRTT
ncbi:PQQ-binding-like beta-propeller repeat protein [Actinomadura sp. LD22]|uniref:PQQ-binding-like beta-propeller repeat protein n=1 Tax=Actinomadura physcomitrii TaxID=2650748 RepID=A0A6I4M2W7_9ACTN|nr:PQQ-binding-like beta-propeller repeat protein [Actinomadura physcomitrii]MWA00103.1 PQQ-binding-like beta-propeller repeat protein [Actinomadura physcomitrii]